MASRLAVLYLALVGTVAVADQVTVRRAEVPAQSRSCQGGTEFVVTLKDEMKVSEVNKVVSSLNRKHSRGQHTPSRMLRNYVAAKQVNAFTTCVPAGGNVQEHVKLLQRLDGVEAIEENQLMTTQKAPWHLDRIDQLSLPLDGTYTAPGTGKGVRVYVVDTGVEASHDNFDGRVTPGFSSNEEDPTQDTLGHGTHCAGIVGSKDYGVAREATIVPVKIFAASGGGSTSMGDIIEGMNWVVADSANQEGSSVMSMSLGGPSFLPNFAGERALRNAKNSGVITVVASGNSNRDACGFWPAKSKHVITVGSTDLEDKRSSFSNYGSKCQDIYAPGSNITSTFPDNSVRALSGTSMACPAVSGAVALYLENQPKAKLEEVREALLGAALPLKNAQPPLLLYVGAEKPALV